MDIMSTYALSQVTVIIGLECCKDVTSGVQDFTLEILLIGLLWCHNVHILNLKLVERYDTQ